MSRTPLIAITTSITVDKQPERAYVNSTYLHAVQQAGGIPVVLPPQLTASSLSRLMQEVDGLLLTGGGDVDPARFGEAPHSTLYDVAPLRDTVETTAVEIAVQRRLPILAVCRGIQVLNVALGGSLYQDVATEPATSLVHSQSEPRDQPVHKVKIAPGSRLAEALGTDELEVNSMHHQAVKALGAGLVAVAWAPDQIVEGIELAVSPRGGDTEELAVSPRGGDTEELAVSPLVLGVQWHPEELVGHSEPARRLFSALVAAARR